MKKVSKKEAAAAEPKGAAVRALPPAAHQEIVALDGNVAHARAAFGEADYIVAQQEAARSEKRGALQRADQALRDRVLRAAKDLGLDVNSERWVIDMKAGTFTKAS